MINLLTSAAGLGLLCLALFGWGDATARYCHGAVAIGRAYRVALGMACLALAGALLNLLGWAVPAALWVLLALGLAWSGYVAYGVLGVVRADPSVRRQALWARLSAAPWWIARGLPALLVFAATGFAAYTLMPSGVFNHGDDLFTYLSRPVRMLQTGTFGGNPFDFMGVDSLGAQALLQGFVLLLFPLSFINGFDAVVCFGLSGLLLLGLARHFSVGGIFPLCAVAALLLIHPQTVNVSAVYSGTAMTLALIMAASLWLEGFASPGGRRLRRLVPLALILATVIALKLTIALVGGLFCLLFFLLAMGCRNDRWAVLWAGVRGAGLTVVTLLPWLLIHRSNFLAALAQPASESGGGNVSGDLGTLLSATKSLAYGASFLAYNVAFWMVLGGGVLWLWRWRRGGAIDRNVVLVGVTAAFAGGAAYLIIGSMFYPGAAVRYACSGLLAVLPLTLLLLGAASDQSSASPAANLSMASLAALTVLMVLFVPANVKRIDVWLNQHTIASYPVNLDLINYTTFSLGSQSRNTLKILQERVPEGSPLLAWVSMPANLDYRRNPIDTVSIAGLVSPWLPTSTGDGEAMGRDLSQRGYRYVLWEYDGWGVTKPEGMVRWLSVSIPLAQKSARNALGFMKGLTALSQQSRIVVQTEGYILFEVDPARFSPDEG